MKNLKEDYKHQLLAVIAIIASVLLLNMMVYNIAFENGVISVEQKRKVVDLPEEINLAVLGDTLNVYKVNADTIFVGYANKRNK